MLKKIFSEMIPRPKSAHIEQVEKSKWADRVTSCLAEVETVYADRNAADVKVLRTGARMKNVPVQTKGGLIDGEVYGELDLPDVGNIVIIDFIEERESLPRIVGVVLPYLYSKFQADQTPVDSGSKAFTLKLLEAGKEKVYRKIFKSGSTLEVDEVGNIIFETPSGEWIKISETDSEIHLNGNTKSLVKFEDLESAMSLLATWLDTHTHSGVTTGGGASGPPVGGSGLDISAAEAAKLKTD